MSNKTYENRTVQASQSSNILRSLQAVGAMEENQSTTGQSQAGLTPQGSRPTSQRLGNAIQVDVAKATELQIIKEAFCVIEDMVKYLETHGHHLSHAHAQGKQFLEKTRVLLS